MTPSLLAGLLVATVGLMAAAVVALRSSQRARASLTILNRLGNVDTGVTSDLFSSKPQRLAASPRMQRLLRDLPFAAPAADMLDQSGLPLTVLGLLGQMSAAAIGVGGAAAFAGTIPAAAVFLGLFATVGPIFLVSRARYLRAAAFEAQLPQAFELIALYLRSGRSLPQAFLGASEELLPPAGEEFAIAAEEYRLGRPLDASLRRLAQKFPGSIGFRLFSVAVSVLGQTGGNLVEVLERIKRSLGASTAYAMRLKALTGESRMSAWILGLLPGVFLAGAAVLNPEYFNLFFEVGSGRLMLAVFLALWAGGVLWIRSLMGSGLR